jgi:hypothetical protein
MLSPAHVVHHLGGVARTAHLARRGIGRRRVAAAIAEGSVFRVRTGVVATPGVEAAVVEAAEHGGALTCAGALRLHGVWTLEQERHPHVWLGGHGRVHHVDCGCTSHFFTGATALGLAPLLDALVHASSRPRRAPRSDGVFPPTRAG